MARRLNYDATTVCENPVGLMDQKTDDQDLQNLPIDPDLELDVISRPVAIEVKSSDPNCMLNTLVVTAMSVVNSTLSHMLHT